MEPRPKLARGAVIAAVVVAIAVLGLFLRLQEYGPESAIRKFHQALQRGSLRDLQRVTIEDVRSPGVQTFSAGIAQLMALGGNRSPRILRTDRTPNQVRLAVAYTTPRGQPYIRVWVVDRKGRSWKVNVESSERVGP